MEKFIYSFVFWYKPKFKHVSCKGSVKRLIKNACRVNRKEGMSLNSIKLAVNLELKLEGLTYICFDSVVDANGTKVPVNVFAEDELSMCVPMWCVTEASEMRQDRLAIAFDLIGRRLSEDCAIAVAIPLSLIGKVDGLTGFTYRIYIMDDAGKVWVHDAGRPCASAGFTWKSMEELEEEPREPPKDASLERLNRPFYIA